MVRDHSFSTYAKLSGNLKFLTSCKAYSSSLLRAVIALNHLPYFKIFSNFVNVPFATFPFEKIAPMLLFSRIGPALIRTSTWIRNVSFSENFAYGLNEWSLSSFFLQYNNLRFQKVTTMHLFLKKNLTHAKKVGHTSEFLFGIYWCIWHFFKRNKKNTCRYPYWNLDMIYSSWDIEQNTLKLVILGHFLPLYTPKKPPKSKFWKIKKFVGDIIILQMCTKITIYDVRFLRSVTEWHRQNPPNICPIMQYMVLEIYDVTEIFILGAIFCPFRPLKTWKIKI